MKKLTLHNHTTVNAEGSRSNGNCKAVLCLDTGEVFSSMTDAAEKHNIKMCNISNVIRGKCRTAGGKRYCLLDKATEYLPEMASQLQEIGTLRAKAAAYDAWQTEQEKARREKEQHDAAVNKAQDRVNKRKAICERIEAELLRATARLMDAENQLNALTNNGSTSTSVA